MTRLDGVPLVILRSSVLTVFCSLCSARIVFGFTLCRRSCGFVSFRGRKIDFERFIGSRCGVILVRTVSDGQVGSAPMNGQVGDLETACAISLTVSCCLRQPRIPSGGTLSFSFVLQSQPRFLQTGRQPGLRPCG